MSTLEKKWLIRSSNTILGPYTKQEIEDLLKETGLFIHDEVTAPCTFWRAIQDHPEFEIFVKEFRSKGSLTHLVKSISGKLTSSFNTGGVTSKSGKQTQTLTTDTISLSAEELEPTQTLSQESRTAKVKEVDFKLVTSPQLQTSPSDPGYRKVKTHSLRAGKKAKQKTQGIWIVGLIVMLGFMGYTAFQKIILPQMMQEKLLLSEIKEVGHRAYSAGNFEKAFQNFEKGLEEGTLGVKEKLLMIVLLIQKNQIELAENLLQSVPEQARSDTRFLLAQGLLFMYERRFSSAEKLFTQAEIYHPKNSLLNLSLLKFFEEDYKASLDYVNKLLLSGYKRGIGFYLKALNQIQISQSPSTIKKTIAGYLNKTVEYHQEFYFLLAYLSSLQGNKKETGDFIKKALEEDPYFVEEYHYDPFLAVQLLDWSFLMDYCSQVFKLDSGKSFFNAINGFCRLKANVDDKGASRLERAKSQAPKHPIILSAYAFHLMKGGFFPKAEEVLETAIQNNKQNFLIPYVMQGRLYEKRTEWVSAFQSWKKVLSLNSYYISGFAGAAVSSFHLNKKSEMKYYRNKGLELYPHQKRLLMLEN
ncbi:MAG: hypothetical protein OXB86_00810 [Bdellovibrionales bacterium]|nr:hypothetical protein [Bdellovibrionales bacterium]